MYQVALCRQLLGAAVDADAPLELACKKAYTRIGFYKGMVSTRDTNIYSHPILHTHVTYT